jgi:uncharacterized protein YndB with AHSA1/START domain
VSYSEEFDFSLPPEEMWTAIQSFERFEEWWPWFRASTLDGADVEPGAVIDFEIVSPLPHDMSVSAEIVEADAPNLLVATLSGDLAGDARLEFERTGPGTRALVRWELEVQHAALRALAFATGPLLQKAHDWAVRAAVNGFRHHLTGSAA